MQYINNKYTKWYYKIITNAQIANRKKGPGIERHHIIPRCLGGTDINLNLVYLTVKEHFVAHLLLTKMVTSSSQYKMNFAFNMMLTESVDHIGGRYAPTSRYYEKARQLVSESWSEINKGKIPWNKGIAQTQEVKDAVSRANTGKIAWNKDMVRTAADKQKMKDGWDKKKADGFVAHNKGTTQPTYICIHCKKSVKGMANFKRWHDNNCLHNHESGRTKAITSFTLNNPSNILRQCEHCGKQISMPNYKRWHGDKCKGKPDAI